MSILSRLFGAKDAPKPASAASEDYKGFRITPEPIAEGKTWRIGAWIEKDVGGEVKRHHLIRADTLPGREDAEAASLAKAKVMIDQVGDGVFR